MWLVRSTCLTIAVSLVLTACITDPQFPRLGRYQVSSSTPILSTSPAIFVSAAAFKGHRRHHDLSVLLESEVARAVEQAGFRLAMRPSEADYELSTELRGWWSPSARFALITLLTLTAYTPLDYKWILDVELTEVSGSSIGSAHERGSFRFETFGIVFFPATIIAYLELVPDHWEEIARESAFVSADFLSGIKIDAMETAPH